MMTNEQLAVLLDNYISQLDAALDEIKEQCPELKGARRGMSTGELDYHYPALNPVGRVINQLSDDARSLRGAK